ncbi:MAG: hypothetical protein P3X24_007950, partial [bacterium]|nr:hypothetical protein [bacterium]
VYLRQSIPGSIAVPFWLCLTTSLCLGLRPNHWRYLYPCGAVSWAVPPTLGGWLRRQGCRGVRRRYAVWCVASAVGEDAENGVASSAG